MGIIGGGFVGSALTRVFLHYTDVKVFDIDPKRRSHALYDVVQQDVLFVCLPTPMKSDGSVDTSIVRDALEQIRLNTEGWKPVILKSTIPPRELREIAIDFSDDLYVCFSPEFLTERTAELDLQQSNRFIFGLPRRELKPDRESVARGLIDLLFESRFPRVPRHWTSFECASLVKYFTNVFFAAKISIFNEFAQLAREYDVNPKEVIDLVMLDARIGRSHNQVPGHDGQLGFGGHCFLKDLHGYLKLARAAGNVTPTMAWAAWKKNIEVRTPIALSKELTQMVGRAASEPISPQEIYKLGEEEYS